MVEPCASEESFAPLGQAQRRLLSPLQRGCQATTSSTVGLFLSRNAYCGTKDTEGAGKGPLLKIKRRIEITVERIRAELVTEVDQQSPQSGNTPDKEQLAVGRRPAAAGSNSSKPVGNGHPIGENPRKSPAPAEDRRSFWRKLLSKS